MIIVGGDVMSIGCYFSISALIIICILTYMFFSKQRVSNIETKIYGIILVLKHNFLKIVKLQLQQVLVFLLMDL